MAAGRSYLQSGGLHPRGAVQPVPVEAARPPHHRLPPELRTSFRPDIEGLRAVAILGVVLYHARVAWLPGGYVGVDVFFVVSGFLITSLLWRDLRSRGRVSFAGFYGRRIRRLLPSAAVVIVATMAASAAWLPPLQLPTVRGDALASALYFANYRFAATATNYLAATGPPSPFLHYWSLGVEEQFYLVWPLVLVGAVLCWRPLSRRRQSRQTPARRAGRHTARAGGLPGASATSRGAAIAALAAIAAGSFGLSLWLTHANEPWAFYSLPTRAWELAVGGLLALSAPAIRRIPARFAVPFGLAGLGVAVASMVALTGSTPFPGTAALAPVLGTAAVLAAGTARPMRGAGRLLRLAPLPAIGRVSYAWYLWHWPVLVLAPYVLGRPMSVADNIGLAALSLGLAAATTRYVERPIRFNRRLTRRPRPSLALGGGLTAVVTAAVFGLASLAPSVAGRGSAPVVALGTSARARHGPTDRAPARSGPGAAQAARIAAATSLDTLIARQVARSVTENTVPANLRPPLSQASADQALPFYDGCFNSFLDATVHPCLYGDTAAHRTVVLFGDSHATMWFPAFDQIAKKRRWRLISMGKATCPPLLLPIISPDLGRTYTECEEWRAGVLALIRADRPAVVVLGMARHYTAEYSFTGLSPAWDRGLAAMIRRIEAFGSRVVVLGRVPLPVTVVPDCLSAHLTDASACGEPRGVGLLVPGTHNGGVAGIARERAAAVAAGAGYIDTLPWFCTSRWCPALVDNMVVYRDDNHITATYASWLAPAVGAEMLVATHGLF
jgi:peptidoglycan/LPS O-acetylase OafA/YrhL